VEKRLTDAERAELTEKVKRRTMDLAWAVTKRQIETSIHTIFYSQLLLFTPGDQAADRAHGAGGGGRSPFDSPASVHALPTV